MIGAGFEQQRWNALTAAIAEGLDRSAEALAEMVGAPARATILRIELVDCENLAQLHLAPGDRAVGVHLLVGGQVNAHIVLLLRPARAQALVSALLGDDQSLDLPADSPESATADGEVAVELESASQLDEMARSALGEVGNVVGSFFLNHLADRCGLLLRPSTPLVVHDMAGAILDAILIDLASSDAPVLVIEAVLLVSERKLDCVFLVMPDAASLDLILTRLVNRDAAG